ncbi:MAG: guanylate kinase [Nannocystaceae bacterium]
MHNSARRGLLLVVSSPSGAGKTTLCNRLRHEFADLGFSVSYTTRYPRASECDGEDYHFIARERFTEMVAADEFAEYAVVHDNMYGTSAVLVSDNLEAGRDLLFDVDFQGGRQLRARFGEDVVLVFILPPSMAELDRRLRTRATDDPETIARRLRVARSELAHYGEYDYVIVNDQIDEAYDALRAVYVGCRQRTERQRDRAEALLAEDAMGTAD